VSSRLYTHIRPLHVEHNVRKLALCHRISEYVWSIVRILKRTKNYSFKTPVENRHPFKHMPRNIKCLTGTYLQITHAVPRLRGFAHCDLDVDGF
jgi:hypothetical protein